MFLNPWYTTEQLAKAAEEGQNIRPDPAIEPKDDGPTTLSSSTSSNTSSPPLQPRDIVSHPLQLNIDTFVDGGQKDFLNNSLEEGTNQEFTAEQSDQLEQIQKGLPSNWTVHLTSEGRFYYCK